MLMYMYIVSVRTEGQLLLTLVSVNECTKTLFVCVSERSRSRLYDTLLCVTRSKCGPLTSNNSRIKKFFDISDLIIHRVFSVYPFAFFYLFIGFMVNFFLFYLPNSNSLISLAAWIPSSFKFFSISFDRAIAARSSADDVHPIVCLDVCLLLLQSCCCYFFIFQI